MGGRVSKQTSHSTTSSEAGARSTKRSSKSHISNHSGLSSSSHGKTYYMIKPTSKPQSQGSQEAPFFNPPNQKKKDFFLEDRMTKIRKKVPELDEISDSSILSRRSKAKSLSSERTAERLAGQQKPTLELTFKKTGIKRTVSDGFGLNHRAILPNVQETVGKSLFVDELEFPPSRK